jgi:hypothetical protein
VVDGWWRSINSSNRAITAARATSSNMCSSMSRASDRVDSSEMRAKG